MGAPCGDVSVCKRGLKRRHLYKRLQLSQGVEEGRGSVELPDSKAEARWSCQVVGRGSVELPGGRYERLMQPVGRGSLELPECRQRLVGAAWDPIIKGYSNLGQRLVGAARL